MARVLYAPTKTSYGVTSLPPIPASAQSAARRPIQAPAEVHALRMSAPSTAVSNGPAKDMLAAPVTAESIVFASCRRTSDAAAEPPIVANAACGCTLNTGNGKASAKRVVTS